MTTSGKCGAYEWTVTASGDIVIHDAGTNYDSITAVGADERRDLLRAVTLAERATRPVVGWVVRSGKGSGTRYIGHRDWGPSSVCLRSEAYVFDTREDAVRVGREQWGRVKRTLLPIRRAT